MFEPSKAPPDRSGGGGRVATHAYKRPRIALASGLALVAVGGCNGATASTDQVLVRGDGFEITVQEYDQVLRQFPTVSKDAITPMRKAAMESLIAEKLLADEAEKAGLDKDSRLAQNLEAARRSLLAKAYTRQLIGKSARPSDAEIQHYYDSHGSLFAARRRLAASEFVVDEGNVDIARYAAVFDSGGLAALRDILPASLQAQGPSTAERFSDESSTGNARLFEGLRAGDKIAYRTNGKLHFGEVQSVTMAPVPLDAVRDRIASAISSERNLKVLEVTVERAKKARNVVVVNQRMNALMGTKAALK